jgi:hypothetical protein
MRQKGGRRGTPQGGYGLKSAQYSHVIEDRQAKRGRVSGRPLARTIRPNIHGPWDRTATDEGVVSKRDTSQEDTPPTAPLKPDTSLPVSFSDRIIHRAKAFMGHSAMTPIIVKHTSDSKFMKYMSSRSNETLVHILSSIRLFAST